MSDSLDLTGFDDLDFTNVSTTFKPRDPGTYAATLTHMEPKRSREKGTPMLVAEFSFTGDAKGKIWQNYILTPEALWRLKGDALKLGCDPALFEGVLSLPAVMEEMINRPAALTIDIESYTSNDGEQKERNSIKRVDSADYLDKAPAATSKKKGGF